MLKIRFYNEHGQIDFCGGGAESGWRITAADGLTFCGRSFVGARYAGQPGMETTQVVINPRTVTLTGDVRTDGEYAEEYSAAFFTLESEGTLEISTDFGKRCIRGRCCDFREGEKKGRYMLFTVQFLCDDPYFESTDKTEVAVFKSIPRLDSDFAFPGMFSQRISRSKLEYGGNAPAEPIFFITVDEGVSGENLLQVVNHTSGESLKFNYGASLGESVTVDTKNRRIYNSKGENLLKYLADDSFFDGFHLYPGENDIEVINRNMNTGIGVTCSYVDRYSEAVYI